MLKRKLLDDHLSWCRTKQKSLLHVKAENLRWTPFVPSPHVQVGVEKILLASVSVQFSHVSHVQEGHPVQFF